MSLNPRGNFEISEGNVENKQKSDQKSDPENKSWYVVIVLCLALFMNGKTWMTFEAVSNQTQMHFKINENSVHSFFIIFLMTFALCALPCIIIYQKIGLRNTLICGCTLNFMGNVFRAFSCTVIDGNEKAGFTLALMGCIIHGAASSCIFGLPIMISSIWTGWKDLNFLTSVPLISSYFGIGVGYLDIFVLMNGSSDMDEIRQSFVMLFIHDVIICCLCIGMSFILVPKDPIRPNKGEETNSTEPRTHSLEYLMRKTLEETSKFLKTDYGTFGLVAFVLNYGNFMMMLMYLSEIVTLKSELSGRTGYIGSSGIVIGGIIALFVGFYTQSIRCNKNVIFAIMVNGFSTISAISIKILFNQHEFRAISAMLFVVISIALCPLFMTVGHEMLPPPQKGNRPCFIYNSCIYFRKSDWSSSTSYFYSD
ncbi:putative MFS-type transporter [Thelohanellus kitauei]|uniref:Putative MFS-type transporter n=1 Tax=Thelohanellus kitauei TaxID=669202 RepID=A0A0C2IXZ9_THEKT|nr:putative MFS-type transporter [Thelohanellus kitauei]